MHSDLIATGDTGGAPSHFPVALEGNSVAPFANSLAPVAGAGNSCNPRKVNSVKEATRSGWPGAGLALAVVVWGLASVLATEVGVHLAGITAGTPNLRLAERGQPLRWRQPEVVMYVDESLKAVAPDALTAVRRAFGVWSESRAKNLPRIAFVATRGAAVTMEPDGVNTVLVAPIDIAGHQNDLAFTVAFSDAETGAVLETDVVINSRYRFEQLPEASGRVANGSDSPGFHDRLNGSDTSSAGHPREDRPIHADGRAIRSTRPAARECGSGSSSGDENDWDSGRNANAYPEADTGALARPAPSPAPECQQAYDLESVLAHEFGHVLGLGEDTEDSTATMYYLTAPCDTEKRTLEESDARAVTQVYAATPASDALAEPGTTSDRRGRPGSEPALAWGTLVLGLLVLGRLRFHKGPEAPLLVRVPVRRLRSRRLPGRLRR
ncbi:matrixin family metalloprotease [Myxococcota bacterium]